MGFDLVSGVLILAGLCLGLAILAGRLWANRDIDVKCVVHDMNRQDNAIDACPLPGGR